MRTLHWLIVPFALSCLVGAQVLTISPNPVPIGTQFNVSLFNNTPTILTIPTATSPLKIFSSQGDLVASTSASALTSFVIPPGATYTFPPFSAAASPQFGPLGVGHYFVEAAYQPQVGTALPSVTGTLTVGVPTVSAPALFFRYGNGVDVHGGPGGSLLQVTNASASATVLSGATATIGVNGAPPGGVPLSLPSSTLAAGESRSLAVPLGAIPANATLDVVVTYNDPLVGASSDLVEVAAPYPNSPQIQTIVHLPMGRIVPLGGSLHYVVQSRVPNPCVTFCTPGSSGSAVHTVFYAALSLSPGAIPLPGGGVLPLAFDSLLIASLSGGLGGALVGSPGLLVPVVGLPLPGPYGGAFIVHPGPAFSGVILYSAGIALTPGVPSFGVQGSALRVLVLG